MSIDAARQIALSGAWIDERDEELVIRAGKSHKFTIPENEVPR